MNIVKPNFKTKAKPKKYHLKDLADGDCFMYYNTRSGTYIKGTTSGGQLIATNLVTGTSAVDWGTNEVMKINTLLISSVEEEED